MSNYHPTKELNPGRSTRMFLLMILIISLFLISYLLFTKAMSGGTITENLDISSGWLIQSGALVPIILLVIFSGLLIRDKWLKMKQAKMLGIQERYLLKITQALAEEQVKKENKQREPSTDEDESKTNGLANSHFLTARETIWDYDITHSKMLYNSGISDVFGHDLSGVADLKEWWSENIHPDDLGDTVKSYQEAIEQGQQDLQHEYRFLSGTGEYKYVLDKTLLIYDDNNHPTRIIGSIKDQTTAKNEERRVSRAVMEAQEQERRYLGQELHDNINQILASSLLTLSMVRDNQDNKEKLMLFTDMTRKHLVSAINEIRKLSHELAPAVFDGSTLKESIHELLSAVNVNQQYKFELVVDEALEHEMPEIMKINIYRILQEQLKNILHYAVATRIEITITRLDSQVQLRVYDNGKGFDTCAVKKGIGLSNIRKRAEVLGGQCNIISTPGKGCEILVKVPLTAL